MWIKDVKIGQKIIVEPAELLYNSGYKASKPLIGTIIGQTNNLYDIAWEEKEIKQVDYISNFNNKAFPKLTRGISVYETLNVSLYEEKSESAAPLLFGLMMAGMGLASMGQNKIKEEKIRNAR